MTNRSNFVADLAHRKLRFDHDIEHLRAPSKLTNHLGRRVTDKTLVGQIAILVPLSDCFLQFKNDGASLKI
jgi:hypothetical protein